MKSQINETRDIKVNIFFLNSVEHWTQQYYNIHFILWLNALVYGDLYALCTTLFNQNHMAKDMSGVTRVDC